MVARTNTLKTCAVALCLTWSSACNLTDPNPPLENNATSDVGGGDSGVEDAGDAGEDGGDGGEVDECGGEPRNACGGCAVLTGEIGDTCSGCGSLVCDGLEGLLCSCETGQGCAFDTTGQNACACADGFLPDASGACVDVDECTDGSDDCDALAGCVNTDGGFTCGECPEGTYDQVGDGKKCSPAFEEIELVFASATHAANTTECLEVTCPAGKVALSGGPEKNGEMRFETSRRGGADGSRWLVCSFSPGAIDWEVRALCAKPNANLVELESEQLIATGTSGCSDATCPDGYRAVGGGGTWDRLELNRNHAIPDGSGWRLCGEAFDQDINVKTSVLCAQAPTNLRKVEVAEDVSGTGCLVSGCEPNETLVGGGMLRGLNATITENAPINEGAEWRTCREAGQESGWWVESICVPAPN